MLTMPPNVYNNPFIIFIIHVLSSPLLTSLLIIYVILYPSL